MQTLWLPSPRPRHRLGTPTSLHKDMPRIHQINLGLSWMDPISLYLERDILPDKKSEAEKIGRKAPRFWLSEDKKLYKHSFSGPYLFCVHPEGSESLLKELHEGVCGIIQEEDPYLIGLLLKDTSGRVCKRRHKNM